MALTLNQAALQERSDSDESAFGLA